MMNYEYFSVPQEKTGKPPIHVIYDTPTQGTDRMFGLVRVYELEDRYWVLVVSITNQAVVVAKISRSSLSRALLRRKARSRSRQRNGPS